MFGWFKRKPEVIQLSADQVEKGHVLTALMSLLDMMAAYDAYHTMSDADKDAWTNIMADIIIFSPHVSVSDTSLLAFMLNTLADAHTPETDRLLKALEMRS